MIFILNPFRLDSFQVSCPFSGGVFLIFFESLVFDWVEVDVVDVVGGVAVSDCFSDPASGFFLAFAFQ